VHPIPSVVISGPTTACTGASVTVTFTGTPGADVVYNDGVSDNPITLDGSGNFSLTFTITQDTTLQIVSVAGNTVPNCAQNIAAGSVGSAITIVVGLPDAIIASVGAAVICQDTGTTILVSGTQGASVAYSFQNAAGTGSDTIVLDATTGEGTINTGNLGSTTTYTLTNVTSTGTSSCTKPLNLTTTITVNPLPSVTNFTVNNNLVCPNDSVLLSFTGTANARVTFSDGATTTDVLLNNLGSGSATIANVTANSTYTITAIASGDTPSCEGLPPFPSAITVTLLELPTTTNPQDQVLCPGELSTTFSVVATGSNIVYQWYKGAGLALVNDTHINGATSNTLVINNPTSADVNGYYVVVSNGCLPDATSATAQLGVDAPIVIVTPFPTGGQICQDDTIDLTVNATGQALTYQWFLGNTPLVDNATISGATSNHLVIDNVTLTDAGTYTCKVNNACNQPVTTANIDFIVNEKPAITVEPQVAPDYCAGQTVTLNLTATGTNITYQWYKDNTSNPLSNSANIFGATSNSLTIAASLVSDSGTYFCILSGSCTPAVTSQSVVVTIKEAPSITADPVAVTICANETINLSVGTPAGTNFTFQWKQDGVNIPGATLSTLSIPNATTNKAGVYTCEVGNGGICPSVTSNGATVIINQAPIINTQPESQNICVGNEIVLTTLATGNNITYQWQFNNVDVPNEQSNILRIAQADFSNAGNYVCIVSSTSCPEKPTNVATINVIALPEATITNGPDATICAGNTSYVLFSGTANATVTYTINNAAPQTVSLSPSGSATVVTGALEATATYALLSVVKNDLPACPTSLVGGPQSIAVVTVNTMPDLVLDQEGYICLGAQPTTYLLETGLDQASYGFQWFLDDVAVLGATDSSYAADTEGDYKVTITDLVTGCIHSYTAPIVGSVPPATITAAVVTNYFDENATIVITVNPAGIYEYRLDDGPYQESNTFEGVRTLLNYGQTGSHTVYARDLKACGEEETTITIIDYPKYFTPNGDGFHDRWNIYTLSSQLNAKIYIFDRFGKLIKQISTGGEGWDGTFNGAPMLADDYWFVVKYSEQGINKEFKAHFSLKR
jgi:gliding motility-associated-like protein